MVEAAEKGRTERTGEFDVRQGEGAALYWLLLQPFSMRAAAGCLQPRCESEKSDSRSIWERRYRALCAVLNAVKRRRYFENMFCLDTSFCVISSCLDTVTL